MEKKSKLYILAFALLLVIIICSTLLGMTIKQSDLINEQAIQHAEANFETIVVARRWNAIHGGVYVKKMPGDSSNPYLQNPDITDTDGTIYTLKPPALMTKEMSRLVEEEGVNFHITSLKLRNPKNYPDDWEKQKLKLFEAGNDVATDLVSKNGKQHFRLMRPLYIESSCLKCHSDQGYKIGEVRGGISITMPYENIANALNSNRFYMIILASFLSIVFILVLYLFVWRLVEKISKQKNGLEELIVSKNKLLGIVTHDLRSPIGNILGFGEVLGENLNNCEQIELVGHINRSAEKMLALVNDLLSTATIMNGNVKLNLESVEMMDFLSESIKECTPLGIKKDISITMKSSGELGTALIDRERMFQVISNLITNAFKFSMPHTEIEIGAERAGNHIEFWVKDHGVGIKDNELPTLFDETFSASSKPTSGEPSFGWGLQIVKRMVELHNGSIKVDSKIGEGTTFTVLLPAETDALAVD